MRETGEPVAEVAWDPGVSAYTLHNWVKAGREYGGQDAGAGGALSESVREETGPAACPEGAVGQGAWPSR